MPTRKISEEPSAAWQQEHERVCGRGAREAAPTGDEAFGTELGVLRTILAQKESRIDELCSALADARRLADYYRGLVRSAVSLIDDMRSAARRDKGIEL